MSKGIPMETVFAKDEETSEDAGVEQLSDVESYSDKELDDKLKAATSQNTESEEKPEEPAKEEPQVEEPISEEPKVAKKPEEQTDIAKLQKIIAEEQALIRRQSEELGELRKKAFALPPPQSPKPIKEEDDIAPLDIIDSKEKFNKYIRNQMMEYMNDMESKAAQFSAQQRKQIEDTRSFINQVHPDFEKNIELMAEVAKEMGETPERIAVFKQNPYVVPATNLRLLYQAAKNKLPAQTQASPAPKPKVQSGALKPKVGGGSTTRGGVEVPSDMSMDQIGDLPYDTLVETLAKRRANEFKGR